MKYRNTAYIIAEQAKDGTTLYYSYGWDSEDVDASIWSLSAIEEARFFSSYEEAATALSRLAGKGDKYPSIEYAWIEKLTTIPFENSKVSLN